MTTRTALWALLLTLSGLGADGAWAQQKGAPGKRAAPKEEPRRRRPPGVRGMFEVAQELFEAGKYPQALQAYDALLRKYPGHEPAMIQTAKTLYRMDRIKEAYGVFSRINPQHLDPETSYEFGWSFYTFKAWEGAFTAFQRVPRGHALYDLANYYGAICAIKLKRYEDAEDMLEKAVVLPDKLAKSRALYIKHVQALRLMQQKSALAKERDKVQSTLDADGKPKPVKPVLPAAPPGEPKHQGFKSVTKSAKVKYSVVHQYLDNHGLKETNFDARVSTFDLRSGGLLPIPVKSGKDRQGALGLQLQLTAEDRITDGREQRIIVDENEQDLQRILAADLGTTDVKSGTVAAEPFVEVPLPEGLWLAAGGGVSFTYPEFERGRRVGSRKGYTELNGKIDALTYGGAAVYTEFLDTETKPISNTVDGSIYVETEVAPKLTGNASVGHTVFDYLVEDLNLDGPDAATRAEATLTQELPFTLSFVAFGSYESLTNYIFHGLPTFGQVAADGRAATGKVKLSIAPLPFISASVQQLFSKTTWSIDNQEALDTFELNIPDYVEEFQATISLNMDF